MMTVNFVFQGTELIGIAARESEEPEKTIPRAIYSTVWRTLVLFVLAILVLSSLLLWQEAGVTESPFVAALDKDQRLALYCGIPFMLICYIIYKVRH